MVNTPSISSLTAALLVIVLSIFLGEGVLANPIDDLLAEKHDITSGKFQGFSIGEDKLSVYRQTVRMNVYGIEVLPKAGQQVSFDNATQLSDFDSSDGIRVTNYRNITFDLYFDRKILKEIKVLGVPVSGSRFQAGDSFESTLSKLRAALQSDHSLVAYSFAAGNRFHALRDIPQSDLSDLLAKDRWHFEDQADGPGGSMYDLRFQSGRLVEIEYFRSRIRK